MTNTVFVNCPRCVSRHQHQIAEASKGPTGYLDFDIYLSLVNRYEETLSLEVKSKVESDMADVFVSLECKCVECGLEFDRKFACELNLPNTSLDMAGTDE